MTLRTQLYGLYTRRLRKQLEGKPIPGHIGVVIDGNRRWARAQGHLNASVGHRYGAYHVENLLDWCETAGVRHVTVFLCSTENLARRGDAEVAHLMQVTEEIVADRLTRPDARWRIHLAGLLDLLPDSTGRALKEAVEHTRDYDTGNHLTLAIGYGGRQEIVEAVRRMLESAADAGTDPAEVARTLTTADIARHTRGPTGSFVGCRSGGFGFSHALSYARSYVACCAECSHPPDERRAAARLNPLPRA